MGESKILGALVYSNLFFFLLRLIVYVLNRNFKPSTIAAMDSFLWSMDTIIGVSIYFFPKFVAIRFKKTRGKEGMSMVHSSFSGVHSSLSGIDFSGAEIFKNISTAERFGRRSLDMYESSCSMFLEEPSERNAKFDDSTNGGKSSVNEGKSIPMAIDMSGSTKSQSEMSQQKQESLKSINLTECTAPMSV